MNGLHKSIIIFVLFIMAVLAITCYMCIGQDKLNSNAFSDLNISDNSSIISNETAHEANITEVNTNDSNLVLPPKEVILNSVNWSNYPLLRNPYIYNYDISDPTSVVNHKFLYVTIIAEATDVRNETEVLKEISGVTIEMKKVLGKDSAPNVWVTVEGVLYYATIDPYGTEVWAKAFH